MKCENTISGGSRRGEKCAGPKYGTMVEPMAFLTVWREGMARMTPLLALGTGRVDHEFPHGAF